MPAPIQPPSTGSAIGVVLAFPVVVGLVVPAILILGDPWRRQSETPSLTIGAIVTLSGLAMVTRAARDVLAVDPARRGPWATPSHLANAGLFAHSRNPGYLAVLAMLAGLSMASRSPLLGIYLLSAGLAFHLWVVLREEPRAELAFGEHWHHYRRTVPRWFPRLGPSLRR